MMGTSSKSAIEFDTAAVTHQGKVRKYNEDSIFTNPTLGLWLVADGMGGHKDGNVASAMIADSAKSLSPSSSREHFLKQFEDKLHDVNHRLLLLSNGDSASIVGSTVAGLIIQDNIYTCIWAGDSRCYRIRAGDILQVSHDHTEVQELVDKGMITKEEARTWPRRNVITRAVGAHEDFQLETVSGQTMPGDCFVLCSDGLTGHISDQEILTNVNWQSGKIACDKLLAMALERGGKDNISIIIVNVMQRDTTTVVHRW